MTAKGDLQPLFAIDLALAATKIRKKLDTFFLEKADSHYRKKNVFGVRKFGQIIGEKQGKAK